MTSFSQFINQIDLHALARAVEKATTDDVRALLRRERLLDNDAITIFSPVAQEFMEDIAARAAALTERRFGKTIQLYAPLYLSNECSNACVYCGFSADTNIARTSLTTEQALADADLLYEEGFRHILLLTGESPGHYGVEDIRRVARALSEKFASVSIEVFPMSTQDYRKLEGVGVDSLTLYQETYNPEYYAAFHPRGPKSNYRKRIEAIEQGGKAGFRSLGIGALLGLSDWRMEAILLAWHARYLTKRFWKSRIAVSFPRVNSAESAFHPPFPVSDPHMVQMITGMRLLLPDADLVLSTREPAALRDNMVGLGITRMSAGSRTNPGGYVTKPDSKMQFSVADHRTPSEVAAMIEAKGYEPVWKDFDHAFLQDAQ